MRVLFLSCDPAGSAVTRYRCTHLTWTLRRAGHDAQVAWIGDLRLRLDHDIVVLHRIGANVEGRALIRAVRRSGARLIYGADDLVFTDAAAGRAHWRRQAQTLQLADGALVSTCHLAAEAARFAPAVVVRNALGDDLRRLCVGIAPAPRFALGYFSGTPTHDADLAAIAAPLARALRADTTRRLLLVGPVALPSELEAVQAQIVRQAAVPWPELPALYAAVALNLAPLADHPFNAGKSELKWLEAAAVGVPTLASARGGYAEAIEDGVDGALAGNWERALEALLGDAPLRRALGQRARQRALTPPGPESVAAIERWGEGVASRPLTLANPIGWIKGKLKRR